MDKEKLQQVRGQFPILAQPNPLIYFDNAATTQKPITVITTIKDFYSYSYASVGRGHHKLTKDVTNLYEQSRESTAKFISAQTDEIVFTPGTTHSLNMIAQMLKPRIEKDDIILLTEVEHHSNLLPFIKLADETGVKVEFVPVSKTCELDLKNKLDDIDVSKVKVFSTTHISNVTGKTNPITDMINTIRSVNPDVITVVDAAQSIAHMPIDVAKIDCDFLVFSAHKMYGPNGVGVMYAKEDLLDSLEPSSLGGGIIKSTTYDKTVYIDAPQRFEPGTPNAAGVLGLNAAINFISSIGIDTIKTHEQKLTAYFIHKLIGLKISGLRLSLDYKLLDHKLLNHKPDTYTDQSSLISFFINEINSHDLAVFLDEDNIAVRSGKHCAHPLHDKALKIPETLRVSFGVYNTQDEIDAFIESLSKSIDLLK